MVVVLSSLQPEKLDFKMPGEPVSYDSLFSLSHPVPSPLTHPDLLTPQDLHREEDLLRNPNSFRAWWTALQATREASAAQQKLEGSLDVSDTARALLGPLASPLARLNFQRLTYLYESALVHFTLWKSYLTSRMSFVCGKPVIRKRAGDKEKPPEMGEARMEIVGCNI
jgi:pre-mRNA-splicing factor SYF1